MTLFLQEAPDVIQITKSGKTNTGKGYIVCYKVSLCPFFLCITKDFVIMHIISIVNDL